MSPRTLLYSTVLIVLWSAIFITTITRPALFDDNDSFHAEVVREMVQSGDWVTMRIDNGVRYLEKAPFMYWLAALSVSAFGLHDWAVRLPLALFSLLLILLVFSFGARFWDEKAGFYSGIVIATCLGFFAFTRIFLPDVILSFFIALCLYMYLRLTTEEGDAKKAGPVDLRCAAFYISAALAVLTKGLIGVIFPGAIIFVHIMVTGNWKVIRRLQIGYGIIIFLIVSAPWHVAAAFANSDFLWFYIIREHLLRYLGMRYPKDYDTVPRLLFLGLHLVWLFPWSAFIWGLVRYFPRSIRPQEKTERTCLFLFIWIGVILTFFLFSTTQEYYTLPTLAAFALLLGKAMADLDTRETFPKWGPIGLGVLAVLTLLTGAGMIALTWWGNHSQASSTLAGTLRAQPEPYLLTFAHLHDLTAATFSHLAPLVYPTAGLLILGPSAAFFLALRKRWMVCFLVLTTMMVGLCHFYNAGMIAFEPVLSSKSLAKVVQYHYRPGDKIVINGFYEKGSTLNYYTGLQVYVMNAGYGVLWYGLQDKTAPKLYLTQDELINEWTSGKRIFLFSEQQPLKSFLSLHPDFNYRVLAESGGKKILVNW
ncbi:MAG TPA: glycosyltransferase family 39 protein [Deltaproteobacteria bacterium]|jgi:4-amino-4-deoxy-L-arabinose transferase-like glycosyltransferase|nr:glycosyltransferase family 39 protein [Deltaproteobacteria bacterium]